MYLSWEQNRMVEREGLQGSATSGDSLSSYNISLFDSFRLAPFPRDVIYARVFAYIRTASRWRKVGYILHLDTRAPSYIRPMWVSLINWERKARVSLYIYYTCVFAKVYILWISTPYSFVISVPYSEHIHVPFSLPLL